MKDGLVIALAAITAISLALNFLTLSDWAGSYGSEQDRGYSKTSHEHCVAKLRAIGRDVSANPGHHPNEKAQSDNKDDLCQQIRMAEAAEESAAYALWQAVAAVGGFFLVILATWFAGRAARWARLAAIAARDSTGIAQSTLHAMQSTAKKELRAYIHYLEGNVINFETGRPTVQLSLKNFGQTPAYDVTCRTRIDWRELPLQRALGAIGNDAQNFGVQGPTAHFVMTRTLLDPPIPEGERALLRKGRAGLFVQGHIHYRDAFDEERDTWFRLVYGGPQIHPEGHLATCEEGNCAT